MKSSKVHKFILDKNLNDIDIDIDSLFENDFDEAIVGIYLALYDLFYNYQTNVDKINYLVDKIKEHLKNKESNQLDNLKLLNLELNFKISTELSNRHKKKVDVYLKKLEDILNNQSDNSSKKQDTIKLFEYLVYKDKNIYRIKLFLEYSGIAGRNNKQFQEEFDRIFNSLLSLDPQNRDVDYYYQLVLLIISKMDYKVLGKNKQKYLNMLYNFPYKKEKYIKTIISVLKGEYCHDLSVLEKKYGISIEYPSELECYSYSYTSTKRDRDNLTFQDVITIDSPNTMRVDDGLYITNNGDGSYTLYVHISDIPAIIPFEGAITSEAYNRAENIYFRDNILNIYSEYLSNNMCSLTPNNKRNVVTFKIKLDDNLNYIYNEFEIFPSKIIVSKKMNYDLVNSSLNNDNNTKYKEMLELLFLFAFNNLNVDKKLDIEYFIKHKNDFQELIRKYSKNKNVGQIMVQEAMKTTGYLAAKLMSDMNLPFLYKSYNCDNVGLNNFKEFMRDSYSKNTDTSFVSKMERSYSNSYYRSTPEPFNKYECYAGVTDPLWKFADSYNLYMIHNYLFDNLRNEDLDFYRTEKVALELNKRILRNLEFRREYELTKSLEKKGNQLRRKK